MIRHVPSSGIPTKPRVTHDQLVPGIGWYGQGDVVVADAEIGPERNTVPVDATAGNVTVTLPPLARAYQDVVVSKRDASGNTVTVDGSGSETINGSATVSTTTQYDVWRFRPMGTEWAIV